jgi:hypothetical protein
LATSYIGSSGSYITDVDTNYNSYHSWGDGSGGTKDILTVAIHEFGHWLGLGHTQWWHFGSVMLSYSGPNRDLNSDDVDGIVAIYGS